MAGLTRRYIDVAVAISYGFTDAVAASILGVSTQTFKQYAHMLYAKLGLQSWGNQRARLTRYVTEHPEQFVRLRTPTA